MGQEHQRRQGSTTPQIEDIFISYSISQVRGEAQGDSDSLEKFVKDLNQGPSSAHVTGVEEEAISDKSGESFFDAQ